jgi:hypothetical protein
MSDQDLKAILLACIERGDYISALRLVKILARPQQDCILAKLVQS